VIKEEEKLNHKILVNTVECWNSRIGSNTLASWLSQYNSENLANLYIREEVPDSDVCGRYFKISENKIIKSVFFRGIATGKEYRTGDITPDAEDYSNLKMQKSGYRFFKKIRLWLFLYLREILWKFGNWKSKELDSFLDDFKPDIVIVPLEGYIHFNRINRYIIRRTGAKAIGVFWDDNFTYKPHKWNPGFLIHRYFLRKDLKKSVALCNHFFAICPKMKTECDEMFHIQSVVLTKPVFKLERSYQPIKDRPIKMLYTGNLLIGRHKALILLVKALKKINLDTVKVMLDIYTPTDLSSEERKIISETPGCVLNGAVPQNEAIVKQKQADVLLFLEALSGKEKYSARLSFSTKITDYFAAGKCIFAVGPGDIAPIEYLSNEHAAIISTSCDEIEKNLKMIVNNPDIIEEFGNKAYECGKRNHSEEKIHKIFSDTLEQINYNHNAEKTDD